MSARAVAAAPRAKEIRGPSAFGGEWRRFASLTWMIAATEFRLSYFGSVLGYLWSLMRPLMLFGVLYVVFSQIIKFGHGIQNYPVLLLMNIVLFTFFIDATQASVTSVMTYENLVRKMQFPRMVIPLSTVLTASLNLGVNLIAVFVFMLASGVAPRWTWLLLPVVLLPLILLAAGVAMLLSSLYPRFRDVAQIWSVLSTLLFYGSPVLYVVDVVHDKTFERLLMCNPLGSLLEQARHWMVDPTARTAVEAIGGAKWFVIPVSLIVGTFALGLWVFNREAPRIAERL
ncbi:MAG: type transport system permease protein [Solirubrobacteraceae bacterium]|jgi:ABC-2 type transport system permease protein|nr:type transport system permease protein [Solirubrobacteraceae bacterium]